MSLPSADARPPRTEQPAVVTQDRVLLDELLRLCAAAGVVPEVAHDLTLLRRAWALRRAVLVGEDQAAAVAALGLSRRDNVLLVSQRADPAPLWRVAVELGAHSVLSLPQDQQRLIDALSDLADGGCQARIMGVVPGRGGAGASTLAAGLALASARAGHATVLVDADPWGGGLELLLGCEDVPGLRWPEALATEGRVGAGALRSALPTIGSLAVLSWDAGGHREVRPGVMRALVDAAQRGSELVVIDLPRQLDRAAEEALLMCDAVLVVAAAEVRAVAACRSLLADLRTRCADLRVLVRQVKGSDVHAGVVSRALDLPLAGVIGHQRGLVGAVNEGLGPFGCGGFERGCRRILDAVSEGR